MSTTEAQSDIPRGGMWERQALFGGKRLQTEFAAGEPFILWGMKAVGDVPMKDGSLAAKTELAVSREATPDALENVNTLSKPINEMVAEATAGDFPVVAIWTEVATSREQNDAVVLTAIRRYVA